MIDRVLPVNTNILSDKRIQEHIRNLKAVYSDKAKAEKAYIWINNFKVKFGKDLEHTVKNINKTCGLIASQAKVLDHETKIFHNLNGGYYSKAALHILL